MVMKSIVALSTGLLDVLSNTMSLSELLTYFFGKGLYRRSISLNDPYRIYKLRLYNHLLIVSSHSNVCQGFHV